VSTLQRYVSTRLHGKSDGRAASPLNFSDACGLSLFLSGCHFSAILRYAFLISSCVAVADMPAQACQYVGACLYPSSFAAEEGYGKQTHLSNRRAWSP
jgi:hypothetical protein